MGKYEFIIENQDIPKYIQISNHIKKLIENNDLEDGEKLPSIRVLSNMLLVNNVTIVNAYKMLQDEGHIAMKIGSGSYVKKKDTGKHFKKDYSDTFRNITGEELRNYIDFAGETINSDYFPVNVFKEVLNEVLDRDGTEAFIYQDFLGFIGLRKSINKYFWKDKLNIEDILIVSGAQQGIDIVAKAIINVKDNVIVEKPTYSGALSVFRGRRANIIEVEMQNDGIDTLKLEKILKKNKIRLFYCMSYFQNPTGISYSKQKKKEILRLSSKYDFYIIEDDYLAELIYDSSIQYSSFKSMDLHDRVIYIKSFSKIFLPGIRIGYLICTSKFSEVLQNSKMNTDISTSSLMQRALDLYISKGLWKDHIDKLNIIYRERYLFMYKYLKSILGNYVTIIVPSGGLNFYLKIKDEININCMELFYRCKKINVLITPGILFYKDYIKGEMYFKLSFSHTDNAQIIEGLEKIAQVFLEL